MYMMSDPLMLIKDAYLNELHIFLRRIPLKYHRDRWLFPGKKLVKTCFTLADILPMLDFDNPMNGIITRKVFDAIMDIPHKYPPFKELVGMPRDEIYREITHDMAVVVDNVDTCTAIKLVLEKKGIIGHEYKLAAEWTVEDRGTISEKVVILAITGELITNAS